MSPQTDLIPATQPRRLDETKQTTWNKQSSQVVNRFANLACRVHDVVTYDEIEAVQVVTLQFRAEISSRSNSMKSIPAAAASVSACAHKTSTEVRKDIFDLRPARIVSN